MGLLRPDGGARASPRPLEPRGKPTCRILVPLGAFRGGSGVQVRRLHGSQGRPARQAEAPERGSAPLHSRLTPLPINQQRRPCLAIARERCPAPPP